MNSLKLIGKKFQAASPEEQLTMAIINSQLQNNIWKEEERTGKKKPRLTVATKYFHYMFSVIVILILTSCQYMVVTMI